MGYTSEASGRIIDVLLSSFRLSFHFTDMGEVVWFGVFLR